MRYFESLSWPISILDSFAVQDKAMFIVKCEIQRKLNGQKSGGVFEPCGSWKSGGNVT